jgi:hypothetical protein
MFFYLERWEHKGEPEPIGRRMLSCFLIEA